MTEEESEDDEEMTISVEYTPMELIASLQLLDYMEISFMEEGIPMGIITIHRRKLYKALLRDDIYEEMQSEKERRMEEFDGLADGLPGDLEEKRHGFQ